MKPVAIVLSGCGRADGSEISEAVFSVLSCSQQNIPVCFYAPDMMQADTRDHLSGKSVPTPRNVLIEGARIARGQIRSLNHLDIDHHSAILFPGGLGAVKNWCSYHMDGINCRVQKDILRVIRQALAVKLPLGFICISPVLAARAAQDNGISLELTIGENANVAEDIKAMGSKHVNCDVRHAHLDTEHRVVSTPAYMLARSPEESYTGIFELVKIIRSLQ